MIDQLARYGTPARNTQLEFVTSWIAQTIDVQRRLELGLRLARWLRFEVAEPLKVWISAIAGQTGLEWFEFSLHQWSLTACNHLGDLRAAAGESQALDVLTPAVARSWERGSLLMMGLIAQAVHLTDAFDHDAASARMRVVTGYFGDLSSLFHDALPSIFPERVSSDMNARALGTWVQSETFGALRDQQRFAFAREISERAIAEFESAADKARQRQYRSVLESFAGEFAEARRQLALSLGCEDSHTAIAAAITGLGAEDVGSEGFALLHWLRLGANACLIQDHPERSTFWQALQSSNLLDSPWCLARIPFYPAHGILRRVAVVHASRGQVDPALKALGRLQNDLAPIRNQQIVLGTVQLAATAEVAVLIWPKAVEVSRRLQLVGSDRRADGRSSRNSPCSTGRSAPRSPRLRNSSKRGIT